VSIKRTKQRSSGRKDEDEADDFFKKPKEADKSWEEWTKDVADAAFVPYVTTAKFEKGSLLSHGKFGKGVVVLVEGGRIEVLFQDGPKKLGHAG
jgi:hypothetical protein